MLKRRRRWALGVLLLDGALQVSGWTNPYVAIVLFLIAAYLFLPEKWTRRETWRWRKSLQIEFYPEESGSSFYQYSTNRDERNYLVPFELWRIRVVNGRKRQRIEAEITSLTPCPDYLTGAFPLPLQFHNQPASVRSVSIGPDEHLYIDVVRYTFSEVFKLILQHNKTDTRQDLSPFTDDGMHFRDYVADILVRGDATSQTLSVKFGVDENAKFIMQPIRSEKRGLSALCS